MSGSLDAPSHVAPTLFQRLAMAGHGAGVFLQNSAAVLSDAELRRKAGSKIVEGARAGVKGLHGGLQGLDMVARNMVQNVTGARKGLQGVLDRVHMRLEQQRLIRALAAEKDMPVDIQIGFHVYSAVPQEMRSRYWMVIVNDHELSRPFRELGRFPDVGDVDVDLRHRVSIPSPDDADGAAPALSSDSQALAQPDANATFVTQPKARASADGRERSSSVHADAPVVGDLLSGSGSLGAPKGADDDSHIPDISDGDLLSLGQSLSPAGLRSELHPMLQGGEVIEGLAAFAESDAPGSSGTGGASAERRGGSVPGQAHVDATGRAEESSSDLQGDLTELLDGKRGDDGWEVVDKLDPLQESSFVGSAVALSLHKPVAADCQGGQAAAAAAECSTDLKATRSQPDASSEKQEQLRLKRIQQAADAKVLQDALDKLRVAMVAVEWPVADAREPGSRYDILLQMTVGQEDVEEIIRRDIHRTFPEHPHFLLGQGQESLFNLLKAYSLIDLVVGYCQGMAFVAGILLMYMPEQMAFKVFCEIMSPAGPNIRRFYLPGLDDLKLEMAKFEWLLERHHPKLFQHLQTNGVPCVLYASQWLLTIFACPFPVDFTARIIDIMLLEQKDHIVMQTAMAIMAETESVLLEKDDFEDIITYLKMEPCQWENDKLQGLISAAYLSSVSESEIKLASEVVTLERVERMMAKPAGRPSTHNYGTPVKPGQGEPDPATPGPSLVDVEPSMPEAWSTPLSAPRVSRVVDLDLDDDMIHMVMEQEIEHLKWAGPSKEHSLIDADAPAAPASQVDAARG